MQFNLHVCYSAGKHVNYDMTNRENVINNTCGFVGFACCACSDCWCGFGFFFFFFFDASCQAIFVFLKIFIYFPNSFSSAINTSPPSPPRSQILRVHGFAEYSSPGLPGLGLYFRWCFLVVTRVVASTSFELKWFRTPLFAMAVHRLLVSSNFSVSVPGRGHMMISSSRYELVLRL